MPPRDWELRIKDIVDAINAIQGYTEGMKYKTFVADRKTVDAVIRNLTVIGEAAGHVPDDVILDPFVGLGQAARLSVKAH